MTRDLGFAVLGDQFGAVRRVGLDEVCFLEDQRLMGALELVLLMLEADPLGHGGDGFDLPRSREAVEPGPALTQFGKVDGAFPTGIGMGFEDHPFDFA